MIISYTLLDLNYLGLECDIAIEKLTFVSFVNSNVVKMFCNALMITFFNSPSTHRLDNDPAGDSRLRCESHLVQNQQHRSSSGPWSNVLMSQLTARSYLDMPNIWTLLLHGQRTCQRLATQRRLETGEARIVCGSGSGISL